MWSSRLEEVAVTVVERRPEGAPVDVDGWSRGTGIVLEALDQLLRTHLRQTEGPEGLFADVTESSPHLIHEVETLRAEHAELRAELDRVVLVARDIRADVEIESVQDSIHAISRAMARHLDREDDLVWRAYDVDLGGGGQ
jgi:esterase/lipase superfamily enzyme